MKSLLAFPRALFGLLIRQAPLFVGAVVLSSAIVACAYGLAAYLYERQIKDASASLTNLSFVISDHANRSMLAVNQSVSKVVDALEARKPATLRALAELGDDPAVRSMLDEIAVDNPFLDSVFIVGADGNVDQRSRFSMIQANLIAGAEYMATLKRLPPGAFSLSSPFESYQFHTWMVNYSKRLSAPDGSFLGAVAGIIKLSSFSNLFDKVNLRSKGSIALFASNGDLLSWAPQAEIPFGPTLARTEAFNDFLQPRRDGVARLVGRVDGVERLAAIANAADFPVSVITSMAMPDVVADWTRETLWLERGAAIAIGLVLLGALRLALVIEKYASRRERQKLERQTGAHQEEMSNALDNVVQGVAMFDARGFLIVCNRRYVEMYALGEREVEPGRSRDDLLAQVQRNGQGGRVESSIKQPDGGLVRYMHMKDGRFIMQRKKKLSDGGWVWTHEDLTERRAAEARIELLSAHDALTGLFNRSEFSQRLTKCLEDPARDGAGFAILHFDLDRFKLVNDTWGHQVGDELLQQAAERIRACLGREADAFRIGADEFAVLLSGPHAKRDSAKLADEIISRMREPFRLGEAQIDSGTCAGLALAPADGADAETLIRNAELALMSAKRLGRDKYLFFVPSMHQEMSARLTLENDLKLAVLKRQFELFFQPILSLKDNSITAVEALIRWRSPERGLVPPSEFIPVAEQMGLIVEIGEWALREACRKAAAWPSRVKVAVNVSPVQFRAPGFLASFAAAISEAGILGSRLVAEITESFMIDDGEEAIAVLQGLKTLGVAISMDDFGTGYSSLSYLRRFPFDKVKIDRSFVGALGVDPSAATIVRAAIALADALGIASVAEGIETEAQMTFLAEAGCGEAQGYLIGMPAPSAETDALLLAPGARHLEPPTADGSSFVFRHVSAERELTAA